MLKTARKKREVVFTYWLLHAEGLKDEGLGFVLRIYGAWVVLTSYSRRTALT